MMFQKEINQKVKSFKLLERIYGFGGICVWGSRAQGLLLGASGT